MPERPPAERGRKTLSFLEAGIGDHAVLLVHGNFASKSWWRELLQDPPPGARLLAPDLPGFGESPGGRGFTPSIARYARGLARFLDAQGIEHPVLLGHSLGSAVALQLALADPGRFPALFLLSPAPLDGLYTPPYLYPLLENYRRDRRALRLALGGLMHTRVPPYLDDLVGDARRMHPAGFVGNARALSGWSVDGAARRYQNPVLVAHGRDDVLVAPSGARATARAFPAGVYVDLGRVGHSPHIEAPEKVKYLLTLLLETLEGVARPR